MGVRLRVPRQLARVKVWIVRRFLLLRVWWRLRRVGGLGLPEGAEGFWALRAGDAQADHPAGGLTCGEDVARLEGGFVIG